MKLAEALAERSDCQKRIEKIKSQLANSARIQEGEEPVKDSSELLSETDGICALLLVLISTINRTNSRTAFSDERMISAAIAERDVLVKRRNFLADVAGSGSSRWDRYSELRGAVYCGRAGLATAVRG